VVRGLAARANLITITAALARFETRLRGA